MKKFLTAGFLAASLACTACATAPIVPVQDTIVVVKVETGIEYGYNTAARLYLKQVSTGQLTGDRKAQAKALLQKALSVIHAIRAAERLGDASSVASQAASLNDLLNQANHVLKPSG